MNEPQKRTVFTIFGSTGDLTYRKLLPAFYNLSHRGLLKDDFILLCVGRKDYNSDQYLAIAKEWMREGGRFKYDENDFEKFSRHVRYLKMEIADEKDYAILYEEYRKLDAGLQLYYLAVAPDYFQSVAQFLQKADILSPRAVHRVIVEKPFGKDLASARSINLALTGIFGERNVYRIDHYLGKEMIQNIMTLRFANGMFESVWDSDHIDFVQINAVETVGVENRGSYYDTAGALQDMVQNHLFQILSLIAMDAPKSLNAQDIRKRQLAVLKKIEGFEDDRISKSLVLGQYSKSLDGKLAAYTEEAKVDARSTTETFAAMRLFLDDPKWLGIPFYLRTGKRMKQRATYVVIGFKQTRNDLFAIQKPAQDLLLIKIQPEEGIYFRFNAKKPGYGSALSKVSMDFCQSCNLENRINTPEAYERLLDEVIAGDDTLFTSWEQVETTWQFAETIRKARSEGKIPLRHYPAQTDGPQEADELLSVDGKQWIDYEWSEINEQLRQSTED
ncbi:MAG: glucose-6-phosphate dehydrogenase [Erysipelotrichaceae bacterium]